MGANTVAVLMIETELPIMMTCADAAIPKGTILKLATPYTVSASSADNDLFGGIAAEEKISGDGKLQIAVYRGGIFKVEAGAGGVTVGLPVGIVALNNFKNTTANDNDLGYNYGVALETAADTEFFLMELGRAG
ncbi:hypothetical protein LCGC14_1085260 [marine sediment metagenome]|uniref:Uncharacterized protein n=1 Tax=marine sediment metagenome TaxID=412755 RepID=A0A0F9PX60_9ZZZZ